MNSPHTPDFSDTMDNQDTLVFTKPSTRQQADIGVLRYALQSYETLDATSDLGKHMRAQVEQLTGEGKDRMMEILTQKEAAYKHQY